MRVVTFIGRPRRFDAGLEIGGWLEAGDFEVQGGQTLWRWATGDATVDLWQSEDMASFVRLRAGAGFEGVQAENGMTREAVTPNAAVEADLTLDRGGINHLGISAIFENPRYLAGDTYALRFEGAIDYERIIIAINDQPVSLHLQAAARKRDEGAMPDEKWALSATAGLRFSLWAPAPAPPR
jgi:hypothetical protein